MKSAGDGTLTIKDGGALTSNGGTITTNGGTVTNHGNFINNGGTINIYYGNGNGCLLYTSPSPRDRQKSRMPSSA